LGNYVDIIIIMLGFFKDTLPLFSYVLSIFLFAIAILNLFNCQFLMFFVNTLFSIICYYYFYVEFDKRGDSN
jgi:hypothetical protein